MDNTTNKLSPELKEAMAYLADFAIRQVLAMKYEQRSQENEKGLAKSIDIVLSELNGPDYNTTEYYED